MNKQRAGEAIEHLVESMGYVTFRDAYIAANIVMEHPYPEDSHGPGYRFADRFLQKKRKLGEWVPSREPGLGWVWRRVQG